MILLMAVVAFFFMGIALVVWGEYRNWFPCDCDRYNVCQGLGNFTGCIRSRMMLLCGIFWPIAICAILIGKAIAAARRAREKNAKLDSELKAEMAKFEREVEAMLKEAS